MTRWLHTGRFGNVHPAPEKVLAQHAPTVITPAEPVKGGRTTPTLIVSVGPDRHIDSDPCYFAACGDADRLKLAVPPARVDVGSCEE